VFSFSCGSGSGDPAAERVLVDVVDEGALALDLHHRYPFTIPALQLGPTGYVDLGQLEPELVAQRTNLLERALAEVAAVGVVDGDALRDRAHA
jgi:hypothetical protein